MEEMMYTSKPVPEIPGQEKNCFEKAQSEILRLVLENTSICEFYYYPKAHRLKCWERMMERYDFPEYIEDVQDFTKQLFLDGEHSPDFAVGIVEDITREMDLVFKTLGTCLRKNSR